MTKTRRRLTAVVWLLVLLGASAPARADSAAPTTYSSEVTHLDPTVEGLAVEVVGGDAFLQIEAAPGVEVGIPGYEGEPYIRIGPGGEVEVNLSSPTHWLNEDRFGRTAVPDGVSAEASPQWEVVAGDGSYGWHDHRIHWMSPDPPPSVDRTSRSVLYEWSVPIVVDGQEVSVVGVLEWVPSISPVPWIVVATAAAGAIIWWGQARWGVVAGAAAATAVGLSQAVASPLGLWQEALAWSPPLAAGLVALVPAAEPARRRQLVGVGTALLLVWSGLRLTSLWMPVLPSPLPEMAERSVVAGAAGAAVGALVVVYRRMTRPG